MILQIGVVGVLILLPLLYTTALPSASLRQSLVAPPPPRAAVAIGVQEASLVRRVTPAYPPLAKSARIQGTVEFMALISKDGRIENLQLVRGHPLLVQAAREAVEQWRYRPTLLNGEPVEVVTDIIVNFTLTQ